MLKISVVYIIIVKREYNVMHMIITIMVFTLVLLKTNYKCVKLFLNVSNNGKSYYDKWQLSQYLTIGIYIYRTRTKFRGLNFRLKISNYFWGPLFSWGVNFFIAPILIRTRRWYQVLCTCKLTFQWFLAPSMLPKSDASTQNSSRPPGTDLRLNTKRIN